MPRKNPVKIGDRIRTVEFVVNQQINQTKQLAIDKLGIKLEKGGWL